MRLNELVGKEMVNIYDGMRMGTVGDSDMLIDEENGRIISIILPNRGNAFTGRIGKAGHSPGRP